MNPRRVADLLDALEAVVFAAIDAVMDGRAPNVSGAVDLIAGLRSEMLDELEAKAET